MRTTDRLHSPAPEELMAYVDGEGSAADRATIETHLHGCAACQALVEDQRRLTGTMQTWSVPEPPATLRAPQSDAHVAPASHRVRAWWRPSRTLAAGLATAALLLVVVAVQQRRGLSEPRTMTISLGGGEAATVALPESVAQRRALDKTSAASTAQSSSMSVRGPSVIRTARLQIVTKDFPAARHSVESIVSANGGFVDDLTVTGDTNQARVLRGTVRVRSDRFSEAMTRLRELGVVLEDTQGTQDVTDQLVDLEARLAGSRATEQRLTELLLNRTGRLSDVLEVERELTRVRVDIERLDAEKTNVSRRVSYATITLTVSEERKESLDGPLPLTTQLKVAALDGIESAFDMLSGAVLFALRSGPSLVVWCAAASIAWLTFRRIRDSRSAIR